MLTTATPFPSSKQRANINLGQPPKFHLIAYPQNPQSCRQLLETMASHPQQDPRWMTQDPGSVARPPANREASNAFLLTTTCQNREKQGSNMIMALTLEPWIIKSARTVHHYRHHGQNKPGQRHACAHWHAHKTGNTCEKFLSSPAFFSIGQINSKSAPFRSAKLSQSRQEPGQGQQRCLGSLECDSRTTKTEKTKGD